MSNRVVLCTCLLLVWISAARGQSFSIDSFSHNNSGQITWTDPYTNGHYRVEWCSSLTVSNWLGDWSTLSHIAATGGVIAADVPLFYRLVFVPGITVTGLASDAVYYLPFVGSNAINYGSAAVTGFVYGATWKSEGNGDGRFCFDGVNPGWGTPIDAQNVVYLGYNPPGFPLGDFSIWASFNPLNENAVMGSGKAELWARKWSLTRDRFQWNYQNGTSSGGTNSKWIRVRWEPYLVPLGFDTEIAVTRSGTNVCVYINGAPVVHTVMNYTFTGYYVETPLPPHCFPADPMPVYDYGLMIGNLSYEPSDETRWDTFEGDIDNVLIFDRCLTPNEIHDLHDQLIDETAGN